MRKKSRRETKPKEMRALFFCSTFLLQNAFVDYGHNFRLNKNTKEYFNINEYCY